MDSLIVTENVSPEERRALDIALFLYGTDKSTLADIAKACHLRDEDVQAALEILVENGIAADCIRLGDKDREYTLSAIGITSVREYEMHHRGLEAMAVDLNTTLREYARLAKKLGEDIPAILKPKTE